MKLILGYIKSCWLLFSFALLFLSMEALCDILQPTVLSYIIDFGIKNGEMDKIIRYGSWMFYISVFGALNAVSRNYLSTIVSYKIGYRIRENMFRKILGFSFENMDRFDGATLMTRITSDITIVQHFINGLMRVFLKAPLLGIGSIVMVARLNRGLLWIYAVLIPVIVIIISVNMAVGYPLFSRVQQALDRLNKLTREFLNGIRVIKAFNSFKYEKERFDKANSYLAAKTATSMKIMAIFPSMLTFSINMAIVFVLYKSAFQIETGSIGIGTTIAFINYIIQFLFACMIIARVFTMFVRAKASSVRISEVLDTVNRMKESINPVNRIIKGEIEFSGVSFSYGSGENVLNRISFSVNAGETLGIIGATGSGKTSIINLITRFYDPDEGKILIDGIPVHEYSFKSLRENIGLVAQKNKLFTGTIEENLRWGKENADICELDKASEDACIYDYIRNSPEGYKTLIGRGGVNLSGGQKQRLAIARALLRNPAVLILDDSTSAVDIFTENRIRSVLKNRKNRMTTVLITQRVHSLIDADQILVIDNGYAAGLGNHKSLLNSCTVYREIFESQTGERG